MHIEQPTSFFDLDNIVFNDIENIDDQKQNCIMESMMILIKTDYKNKFTNEVLKELDTIIDEVKLIITCNEYEYFNHVLTELNIILTDDQLNKIMENIAYLIAFQFNFNESSQAKMVLINYINNLDNNDKKMQWI